MSDVQMFNRRRAAILENAQLRVVVLEGGGHIAAVVDKATGVNPLWAPPWRSIEPANFRAEDAVEYGAGAEGPLLAGIMGHNLCVDIFGGPSPEEAAAGLTVHGEGSFATYAFEQAGKRLTMRADFRRAQLRFARTLELVDRAVRVEETLENIGGTDRPIAWTQHVTLGPPFLERGRTEVRASATRSSVFARPFGAADYLVPGAVFDWPHAPRSGGGTADLRRYSEASASSAYTAHLMDQDRADAFFVAFSPSAQLAFGYVWRTNDFPWMGIWEENHSRDQPPWNGRTMTRGMEFGVSPIPESRREMVERARMFGVPTFRWIPAGSRLMVEYWIVIHPAASVPEVLERPA
jgi:hypothetical protein